MKYPFFSALRAITGVCLLDMEGGTRGGEVKLSPIIQFSQSKLSPKIVIKLAVGLGETRGTTTAAF